MFDPPRKKTSQLLAAVVAHAERLSEDFLDIVLAGASLPGRKPRG
jgi:hypothetical protein